MSRAFAAAALSLLTAAGAATGSAQPGPGFDCARASGQVETLVCGDPDLAALDRRLAEVWAAALKEWPADVAAEQRSLQRGWIGGRDECWKDDDVRACTELSYRTRIVELQIRSGQLEAPSPMGYACTGAEAQPFTATFYRDSDPPSAVLTLGNDQVVALVAPSGSGARYAAANVEFWEHQGEATVDWFGTTLTCRPLTPPRFPLAGTAWRLTRFQSMDDSALAPGPDAVYALAFGDDGTLRVQSDCNRGQGSWRSPDDVSLELGPVALTRAACPPSPLQERFVRDLGFVRSYVVHDGTLFLSLMADGGIYELEPARLAP